MKRVTNLSTEILNIKINEFIRLAINNNINAAYYYYSEYLTKNHDEIDSFNFSSSIVEHVFLNTSSYLGNIPDLDVFLIYANLLLNSNLDQENEIKAKALVYYFIENSKVYAEEMDNPNYLKINRIIKNIKDKHPIEKNDFDLVKVYIGKINNANRLFISDWIETEIDYR